MSSLYTQILEATQTAVEAIDLVSERKIPVVKRKRPSFLQLTDVLPQIIVAPRPDLVEIVIDQTLGGTHGHAVLGFQVFIGMVVDSRPRDYDQLDLRLQFREDVRLALWKAIALDLAAIGEFDVEYDSAGQGADPDPPNCDGSWQSFVFAVQTPRSH